MRLYCLFIAVSSSDVPSLSLRNSEILLFFLLLHPYAQHCIPSLPISFSFSNLYLVCFRELSTSAENVPKKSANFYCWCAFCTLISILTEGLKRFLFPISQPKFSPNPIFLVTALFKFYSFLLMNPSPIA